LLVETPQLASGYWRDPELTADAVSDGVLRPGYRATLDAEGHLHLVDAGWGARVRRPGAGAGVRRLLAGVVSRAGSGTRLRRGSRR
uniref:AMP-binding protein n=1 Tax=Pseudonocardia pini TaxID=2758030 RepID=UPI0015F060EA